MTTTDRPGPPPAGTPGWAGAPSSAGSHGEDTFPGEIGPSGRRPDPRHFGIDPSDPWPDDVPRDQDDSHWRYENDPKRARRAELRVAFCWTLTLLASIGLAITYVEGGQAQAEGACWAVAFLGLGVGFILWARDLLPGNEITASRGHHDVSHEADRRAVTESLSRGIEPMARRPFLFKMLGAVGGVFGLAVLFPFASLGPRPHVDLYRTKWGKGTRAVTEDGTPIRPSDLPVDGIMTVFPEGNLDDALSPTLLINVGNEPFEVPPNRVGWNLGGVVAFSKICTHAGCPASLYNVETHQLICPCHQSTFDVLSDCKPVFGPASRSLPQLPLATDSDGYVVSQSDYTEAVGPGFWNRG
jgi:ubiquinol-cytochrome c reductase iron-sulfur subunit